MDSTEKNAIIAERIMNEPKPAYVPDAGRVLHQTMQGGLYLSGGRNWHAVCIYENGDTPEWRPIPFDMHHEAAYRMEERIAEMELRDAYIFELKGIVYRSLQTTNANAVEFGLAHATPGQRVDAALAALEANDA